MRTNLVVSLLIVSLLLLAACHSSEPSAPQRVLSTDRDRDGLFGPVRAVLTEDVLLPDPNSLLEGQLASSVSIYDESGRRTRQTPYQITMPNGRAVTNHEALADPEKAAATPVIERTDKGATEYDTHGNIVRRQINSPRGELSIRYEYDSYGNWVRRFITRSADNAAPARSEASYRYLEYFGQAPATVTPPAETPAATFVSARLEDERAAQTLFAQRCQVCHGENGQGRTDLADALTPAPTALAQAGPRPLTAEAIFARLREPATPGRIHALGGRVAEERLQQLSLYVKQLSQAAGRSEQIAKATSTPAPKASSPSAEERYPLKGKVISTELNLRQVVVEHENIPGYMEAMTMPFPLPDDAVLRRLKKGDRIEATLVVGIGFWRLENVVVK